jgi:hypothetical protein
MNAEERKRAENAHFFMRKYIEVKDWGAFLIVMNQQLKRAEQKAISEYKEALKDSIEQMMLQDRTSWNPYNALISEEEHTYVSQCKADAFRQVQKAIDKTEER